MKNETWTRLTQSKSRLNNKNWKLYVVWSDALLLTLRRQTILMRLDITYYSMPLDINGYTLGYVFTIPHSWNRAVIQNFFKNLCFPNLEPIGL